MIAGFLLLGKYQIMHPIANKMCVIRGVVLYITKLPEFESRH
ncbi:hypothetical protein ACVWYG_002328 [Pedobacter sp. UYEF25]